MALTKVTGAGLGTITANADFNGNLDVDGTIEVDDKITIAYEAGSSDWELESTSGDDFTISRNGSQKFIIDGSTSNVGIGTTSPAFATGTGLQVKGSNFTSVRVTSDSSTGIDLSQQNNGTSYLYNRDNASLIFGTNNADRMKITSTGTLESLPTYNNTTGSGANVHISSAGGLLFRSTSSLRYKNTVNDATHGLTELLTLRPVTYKGNNDGDIVFGGLIAEEVHDAGLTEFVQYNEDNEPDALAYGNMVSLCIKAIQELKTELDNAKARITALESA